LLGLDGKRLGVEPRQLRLLEFRCVREAAPEAEFPDASGAVAELRLRKDRDAALRAAVDSQGSRFILRSRAG